MLGWIIDGAGIFALYLLYGTSHNTLWWTILGVMIFDFLCKQAARNARNGESGHDVLKFWIVISSITSIAVLAAAGYGIYIHYSGAKISESATFIESSAKHSQRSMGLTGNGREKTVKIVKSTVTNETKIITYSNNKYNFTFQFPSDWKLDASGKKMDGGKICTIVQGPDTFCLVTVGALGNSISKEVFDRSERKNDVLNLMMNHTIKHVYEKSSRDMMADNIVIAEKKIEPCEIAIKFYITAMMTKGNQKIINTGLHYIPFEKDYLISFIMMAPLKKDKEFQTIFNNVLNSFRLKGENPL
jgi:hypothetical protein